MTQFARRPFKRLKSPAQYNALRLDQQLINVEQAMPPQSVRTVVADTTATTKDQTIAVDATDGAVTVTLPLANQAAAFLVTVVKIDSSAHAVTIGATSSGVTNPTLTGQYDSITMQSIGTEYLTVARV